MPNLRGKTWTTTTPATVGDAQFWEDHLISDAESAKIDSAVQSVNGNSPDASGNVDVVALPDGGTVGQVLTKQSSADGDADWDDPASSGHTIEDADGTTMPYQSTLQFVNADVTNDGVNHKTVVDCKGSQGDPGQAATIAVGTTTTLAPGSSATVTNSGTSSAAIFDFGIPRGADGTNGMDGTDGADGVGVTGVTLISTSGKVKTYRMAFSDSSYFDFNVTDGADGTGAGDMLQSDYDDDGDVYNAGGIPDYVAGAISGKVDASALANVATTGDYDDLLNKPTIPAAQVNANWNAISGVEAILNKPTLATVATSGSYDDLINKPSIPAAQVNSDWNAISGVQAILNKPTIPSAANNGTLTIQQNGATKGTFTADQSTSSTANIVTDTWHGTSGTVTSGAVTFTGVDDSAGTNGYEVYVNVTSSSTNMNPTAQISTITGEGTSSMSISFTTDADEGASAKLRIIK